MDRLSSQIRKNGDKKADVNGLDTFSCSLSTLHFISRYWPSVSGGTKSPVTLSKASIVLGQNYPQNITAWCKQGPYCLYVYYRVKLMKEEKGSVVLIGYFDHAAGVRKVKLLDVIESSREKDASLWNCLGEMLKKLEIPLVNLAAFYSDAPNTSEILSGLRELNPRILSLGKLGDLAGQACRNSVTVMEQSGQILGLLQLVHQHLQTLPVSLRKQFRNMDAHFMASVTSHCVLLRTTIYRMTKAWSDLLEYFSSQRGSSNIQDICNLLRNHTLRATFLFLACALQPLCEFQERLDRDEEGSDVLQDACGLVELYGIKFLRPKEVENFFRRRNSSARLNMMEHLPRSELKVGKQVVEYLQQNDVGCLDLFYKDVISFYKAVTSSIVGTLPLPIYCLRNMGLVLSPGGMMDVTGNAVTDLGVHFGVCPRVEDVSLLTDEFLDYQFAERERAASDWSVEQYWRAELRIMGRRSIFRKLILSLLAIPKNLRAEKLFARVFDHCMDDILKDMDVETSEDEDTVQDDNNDNDNDVTDSSSYKSASSSPFSPETQESVTSDFIDLTKVEDVTPMEINVGASCPDPELKCAKQENVKPSDSIVIDEDDDDEDDDIIWTETLYPEPKKRIKPFNKEMDLLYKDGECFVAGELVWAQVDGIALWPGLVQRWPKKKEVGSMRKVARFGDGVVSEVHIDDLRPYTEFAQSFCPKSFATLPTYKEAVCHSLRVAAERAEKVFSLESDCNEDLLSVMMNWACGGFKPSGPKGLQPRSEKDVIFPEPLQFLNCNPQKSNDQFVRETAKKEEAAKLKFNLKEVSVCLKKLSLDLKNGRLNLKADDSRTHLESSVQDPTAPAHNDSRCRKKYVCTNKDQDSVDETANQRPSSQKEQGCNRYKMAQEVLVKGKNIEDFCLSCGTANIEIFHPLFEGSLCLKCKDNFTETLYRYDEDGYQSYCTVCCAGMEVILCGLDSCCRSYCVDCLDILIGKGTFNKLKDLDPWICYLCAPESSSGALKPRHDWSIRVQEFFANNSAMAFEPHRVYPSIPANLRRPIRVLSLFDGIGTGYLVLKDLGFKVEKYIASEIDEESTTVSMVNHDGKIIQIDDVRLITKKHLKEWGPFDLLIGGSPCNDLSIVNPARKGLFEGTGRLFFDFYRLLNMMKPKEDDPRPFFWLFENVVFMNSRDKADICRFLECNPVLVDAVKVSPAHRARYFWGNLPGMNRPIIASQYDKLTLQECLEKGRTAKYVKVRTITTRSNSLKQGANDRDFPVTMHGKDDNLWITELEKIFGFPKHYTDVKNMGRLQRQKVLGKSWSVPVIRHLFAPLKDYFACDEVTSK